MDYWPSYRRISPGCRAAYLEWLAGGRQAPDANIGYVFLFFYGVERRVLVDLRGGARRGGELGAIRAEVVRLRAIYAAQSRSFDGYSSDLLAVLDARLGDDPRSGEPCFESRGRGLPVAVRLALGRFAQEGAAVSSDWALAWYAGSERCRLRTAASHCWELFRGLFRLRYESSFDGGVVLQPRARKISIDYSPASAGLLPTKTIVDIPDVAENIPVLSMIAKLAEDAQSDIDPYSRYLGRNPGGAPALPGLALLPADLLAHRTFPGLQSFYRPFEAVLEQRDWSLLEAERLTSVWPCKNPERMAKAEAVGLVQLLDARRIGIEPDVRFGGRPPRDGGHVVLFRLPQRGQAAASAGYAAGALIVHLASLVAHADGDFAAEESAMIEERVESQLRLEPAERARLRARLRRLESSPPGYGGLKKRAQSLPEARRQELARFCIDVAWADGQIDPGEVETLEKIYGLLGLDDQALFSDLHGLSGDGRPAPSEPVTVRRGDEPDPGFAIPPEGASEPGTGLRLDPRALQEKLAETAVVSRLLAAIFEEEEEEEPASVPPAVEEAPIGALDGPHSRLLRAIGVYEVWSQADFEELVGGLGLLPAGAMEILNDASFELVDEPLLEGDDPLYVNPDALKELLSA